VDDLPRVDLDVPRKSAPADDLLQEANRLRGERKWAEAARVYGEVARSRDRRAYAAKVALASLRLEHLGDPAGALALFQAALTEAPRGPLAEEALWGIAASYRVLGDTEHEREALLRFVTLHPDSASVSAAQTRLERLGGAGP
jgi:tetratricopeptide (TPR) repeat protein